ncbi:MAG: aspartate aminotransferase family protein [Pseudomonadota bacterium]
MSALMNIYARLPIAISHGEGSWLWDDQGRRFLDGFGGIAVTALGHAHPRIARAIAEQAGQLMHTSNALHIPLQQQAGDALCEIAAMDAAIFCNSGAEANEAALKIARLHARKRGIDAPRILVMHNSFHGRTLATLSATGSEKVQAGFGPLVPGFIHVPFDDLDAIDDAARNHDNIVAVLVEPIQGEGGICPPSEGYLRGLRARCDAHDWLLMFDEIQCGMGRTGRWFAHQHAGIQPDVMSVAKALGNGFPVGACLARGDAATLMQPGNHGTTYGGNPLASRVVLEVIAVMREDHLLERAAVLGAMLSTALREQLNGIASFVEVRGQGLMIGVAFDRDPTPVRDAAVEEGLLLVPAGQNTLRLLPAYTLSDEDALDIAARLCRAAKRAHGAEAA